MAFPTAVNSQITDAVTQSNVKVLADAPAMALGSLYQATAQALGNSAHNATTSQQQTGVTAQAATTMGTATLYALDTASTGKATEAILRSQVSPLVALWAALDNACEVATKRSPTLIAGASPTTLVLTWVWPMPSR